MATIKKFGKLFYQKKEDQWVIDKAEPHVCIKVKQVFPKIAKSDTVFKFKNTIENCADLKWFTDRYQLSITPAHRQLLLRQKKNYDKALNERDRILLASYRPHKVKLNTGKKARRYQLSSNDLFSKVFRMLLADEIGLGKTLSAILAMLQPGRLPALVVCPTHIATQWQKEIAKYTNLTSEIIDGHKVYDLESVDVYIIRYSCLAKWIDVLTQMGIKYAIFDECQEFRRAVSQKYEAGEKMSDHVDYCQGLSATPINNLGGEIYNVLDLIKPGCLGERSAFAREWMGTYDFYGDRYKANSVKDPVALGTYLRREGMMLRRTREEVGLELPQINKLIYTVDFDQNAIDQEERLCRQLAMQVLSDNYEERMYASGQLDMRMRQVTGVSKAKGVAAFVKMMLDNGDSVLLGGWHKAVYRIWVEEFKDYNPLWYTGKQSPARKNQSKEDFIAGKSKLLIMSLKSGSGADGLQDVCWNVVHGELDYSPQVHRQFTGRIDRPGQKHRVSDIFLNADYGSDPGIINTLGIKTSQAHGIVDPLKPMQGIYTDESRIKAMAKRILEKHRH